jgi:hypothetical protein
MMGDVALLDEPAKGARTYLQYPGGFLWRNQSFCPHLA